MLILRRKIGQHLVLAGTIQVVVLSIDGDRVKLGIDAPPEVKILRGELVVDTDEAEHAPDHRNQG